MILLPRTTCAIMDLATERSAMLYPIQAYTGNITGEGAHLRTPYTACNTATRQILVSLPADHNIQLVDSNWQVKEVPAATRKNVCITSMGLSKGNKQASDAEYAWQYFSTTPSYRNIIYDPYHFFFERYYRILELPRPADSRTIGKDASLIAFDKKFRYLGEAPLPGSFALDNFFLRNEGIYFLNIDNKDQNTAQYVQCKIGCHRWIFICALLFIACTEKHETLRKCLQRIDPEMLSNGSTWSF